MKILGLWLAFLCVITGAAMAAPRTDTLTGRVRVIDGDSLKMGARDIRLFGIDAFEYKQTCGRFACGKAALMRLKDLTNWQVLSCRVHDTDGYGRSVAQCFDSHGRDIAKAMVASGFAVAYRSHSRLYMPDEARARKDRAGAWAYPFQSPETYRHGEAR